MIQPIMPRSVFIKMMIEYGFTWIEGNLRFVRIISIEIKCGNMSVLNGNNYNMIMSRNGNCENEGKKKFLLNLFISVYVQ